MQSQHKLKPGLECGAKAAEAASIRTGGPVLERFNAEFSAALLGFNREAVVYCKGISDIVAQEYAIEYARMLQNRAKGIEVQLPPIPAGLFEPNRKLIRFTLERMWLKHFPES